MYSPAFIASKVASAQDAAAAGRYDIAERKFLGVSSFTSFNVAVVKASAGDARGRQIILGIFCAVAALCTSRHPSHQAPLKSCRTTSPTATCSR